MATPTVLQEQPYSLAGTMTLSPGNSPCLVHLMVQLRIGTDGQVSIDNTSPDFLLTPGPNTYSAEIDQRPEDPLPANVWTVTAFVISPDATGNFANDGTRPIAGTLTVQPGEMAGDEATSPPPSPSPVPPGQIHKCEVQVRVNGTTTEWIPKPLAFCKAARQDEQ